MNRQHLYIFDLDGTLALVEHRRHLVQGPKPDWPAFFRACDKDTPNLPVIRTMLNLRRSGAEVRIWSGRSEEVRHKTEEWLRFWCIYEMAAYLRMRPAGDHQPDELLKGSWLEELSGEDRARLIGIFDDRDKVVAMWRSKGVTCFQVAPGDF